MAETPITGQRTARNEIKARKELSTLTQLAKDGQISQKANSLVTKGQVVSNLLFGRIAGWW
jgi:hypothetical protein